MAEKLLTEQKS